jgi:hypothetical protein
MKHLLCALVLTFGVAYADIPDNQVNQTYDGAKIKTGTYFNTYNGETKFINSAGTGITLDTGHNIRGLEVNNGALFGNGGNIHIQAPNQVVKINGNIDVRGIVLNWPTGPSYGNGGTVTIDASYLYQNGNIYAGGLNGGLVSMNVGGMLMGPSSHIDASGNDWQYQSPYDPNAKLTQTGLSGQVTIKSTGNVTIPKGAHITTAGPGFIWPSSPEQSNIVIIGKCVNMDGVLHAARAKDTNGGSIALISNDPGSDVNIGKSAILQTDGGNVSISSGRDINNAGLILTSGYQYATTHDVIDGTFGVAGGNVSVSAARTINNSGRIQADSGPSTGGIGGASAPPFYFYGTDSGTMIFTAHSIINNGVIRSNGGSSEFSTGGKGGDITFVGSNPTGSGIVSAMGGPGQTIGIAGTITAPNPIASSNKLYGIWKKSP